MTRKRAPCVDMRTDVVKDERFAALGQIAGFNRYEAIGRMFALWAWCTDRGLRDAPDDEDGYVVSERVVQQFLGSSGAMGLLAEDCSELALAEKRDGGRYYLKGTSEYVGKLRALHKTRVAGGNARVGAVRESGRFVSEATTDQRDATGETSRTPADAPAATTVLPPSYRYIQRRHADCGKVSKAVWNYAAVTHAEIRLSGIDKHAPVWTPVPDPNSTGWQLLLDRMDGLLTSQPANDAERVGKHRVDVAAATARKTKSLRWFVPITMFKPENFELAAAMSIDSAASDDNSKQERSVQAGGIRPTRRL